MRVFDAHIHVQPWQMVKPEVLAMIDDPSHANAKDILASPENFLRHLDAEGIERACCINYVSPDDNASPATKASKPLREARIDVVEVPGKPGVYRAVAFLRPHFQLDELSVSLRLVADLPPSTRG